MGEMVVRLCLLGLAVLIAGPVLAYSFPRVRGTTLLAPWCWTAISLIVLLGTEFALTGPCSGSEECATKQSLSLRYVAMVGTFCPLMALFGAKRPQDRGWQFVVVSLWIIACLPMGEWLIRFTGEAKIHAVPAFFLIALILMGLANYLPTRFAPAVVLLSLGQILMLIPYLPWEWLELSPGRAPLYAIGCIIAALLAACWVRRTQATTLQPLDRLWLDFRSAFGVVWALRVMERINALARQQKWELSLSWDGFVDSDEKPLTSMEHKVHGALSRALRTLMRRFVSPEWINKRLQEK